MESKKEIHIDKYNLKKATTSFKNKLSKPFEESLSTILEQNRDSMKPLIGYYISAKKGKNQLYKKIAIDVSSILLEVFVANFMEQTIQSPHLKNTLETLDENVKSKQIKVPNSINPLSEHGVGIGVDSKGNPTFNLEIDPSYDEKPFVKFLIKKGIPPIPIEQKMIFKAEFSGGFFDMKILDALTENRSLNFGELGGDLMMSLIKLPFSDLKINQRMYDNYASIPLNDMQVLIPKRD